MLSFPAISQRVRVNKPILSSLHKKCSHAHVQLSFWLRCMYSALILGFIIATSVEWFRSSIAPNLKLITGVGQVSNDMCCHILCMRCNSKKKNRDLPPDVILICSVRATSLLILFVWRHTPAPDELHSFSFGLNSSIPPNRPSHVFLKFPGGFAHPIDAAPVVLGCTRRLGRE
jgi:hypothetical protein